MEPNFLKARLFERRELAEGLFGFRVDLENTTLAASLTRPGQYVQLRGPNGNFGYFAIASKPGEGNFFDFLIKAGTPITDDILALRPGDPIELTSALGPGYPIGKQHTGKDILLFAAGTGISPIRSLIWYLAAHRSDYAGVTLFYGARTPAHFAYQEEITAWELEGINVCRVVSQATGDQAGYAHGYVQDALRVHAIVPGNTVAFVCGMPAMVSAVKAELASSGVKPENIFENY